MDASWPFVPHQGRLAVEFGGLWERSSIWNRRGSEAWGAFVWKTRMFPSLTLRSDTVAQRPHNLHWPWASNKPQMHANPFCCAWKVTLFLKTSRQDCQGSCFESGEDNDRCVSSETCGGPQCNDRFGSEKPQKKVLTFFGSASIGLCGAVWPGSWVFKSQ